MREILFRGKDIDNGIFVTGYLIGNETGKKYITLVESHCKEVIPETVGQYTGLTDKNGKRIFEGDVLESRYDEKHFEDACCEVVLWWDNSWCIQEDGCADPDHLSEDDMLKYSEVVGNIHDNPELLKGGAE